MGDPVTMAAVSSAVGMVQQQSQARAQAQAQQAATQRRIQQEQMAQARREKELREKSKRDQAAARANFGARGVSSVGGSANALLDGISASTEERIADDRRQSDFGIQSLRENQRSQQRMNLLQSRNSIFNTVLDSGMTAAKGYFKNGS